VRGGGGGAGADDGRGGTRLVARCQAQRAGVASVTGRPAGFCELRHAATRAAVAMVAASGGRRREADVVSESRTAGGGRWLQKLHGCRANEAEHHSGRRIAYEQIRL
jgi:hypothetical protein